MNRGLYENIIRRLCESADIPDWKEVLRTQHVTVRGKVVGLINEDREDFQRLLVYVDMGPLHAERDADMYRRMLMANLDQRRPFDGCFGLHPSTGGSVYHMRLNVSIPMEGGAFAELLVAQIDAA